MGILNENMIKLLNYRIEQEEYSSRLYQAISVCMNYKGYTGASKLFDIYSKEELLHAKIAYEYLLDLDIRPIVPAIKAPPAEFDSLPQVLLMAYEHEKEITNQCNELAKSAIDEGDFMTLGLAQRYLKEQIEEEAKTNYWLNRLDVLGGEEACSNEGLFLLDKEMKHKS